jgi:5-methylcytosine-specific restriction endonuclease McrA
VPTKFVDTTVIETTMLETRARLKLKKKDQISIFRRDGWLCRWCKRPVIFGPAMKHFQLEVQSAGASSQVAYHDSNWTRRSAPLLDELGAVLDHVEPFAAGGACSQDNLVTSCAKCNGRKSAAAMTSWNKREKRVPIKGKYGEPENWDGLSGIFILLAERNLDRLTPEDKSWLSAFIR